jgi:putative oxidoreductase
MLSRFLNARFAPTSTNVGLLILRVGIGLILFLKHGWEKISVLSLTNAHFPDPIHIGTNASWTIAVISDGICSLLIVLGVGTRWVALFSFCTLFTAWTFVHHYGFFGKTPNANYGELIAQYIVTCIVLMVAGPGPYSVDGWLARREYKSV